MLKRYYENDLSAFFSQLDEKRNVTEADVAKTVSEIINDVKLGGDASLRKYTEKFDGVSLENFEVSKEKPMEALERSRIREPLIAAANNIKTYHEHQLADGFKIESENGCAIGRRVLPLKRVGVYVPGGKAAYPSSVLMNAIPAKVAGVEEIIMVTPPPKNEDENTDILAAAAVAGVDRIFYCGGAQALAALAYGTESVPKVDKIVGPGNIFVATAKKLLFGTVDIDMIAGPSEICVIADENAPDRFVAADLLSQAEHDELASSILVCFSEEKAKRVEAELEKQIAVLPRSEIILKSLANNGAVLICKDMDSAIDAANKIASEHLELCVEEPFKYLDKVRNAGSVFLGYFSPEPLGDYYAGPNHVLPTSGTARFFSPLSVESFTKTSSFIYYTQSALSAAASDITAIAKAERLMAHANAIEVREGK
ncbi:MAG: histidinol dehydrogenase [Ruminococcaceae bacterium]|nr:histidinol dehydrogenase [Oscillospiraceae bacterium]